MVCNIIAMIIGTALTKVTKEEQAAREVLLFLWIVPYYMGL